MSTKEDRKVLDHYESVNVREQIHWKG